MNDQAIEPISAVTARQAATTPPPPKAPAAAPAVSVAALMTPAATVATSSVPTAVKPEDRALYLQILKSFGGNVTAALASLAEIEAAASVKS